MRSVEERSAPHSPSVSRLVLSSEYYNYVSARRERERERRGDIDLLSEYQHRQHYNWTNPLQFVTSHTAPPLQRNVAANVKGKPRKFCVFLQKLHKPGGYLNMTETKESGSFLSRFKGKFSTRTSHNSH